MPPNKKKTTEEFIRDAIKVHGNKYDYSKVEYTSPLNKVELICPTHGCFYQIAKVHLGGHGCPACAKQLLTATTEHFIKKSRSIHGDKYDYSESIYLNCASPIKIICPIHGFFYKTPHDHYAGQGCQQCSKDAIHLRIKPKIKRKYFTRKRPNIPCNKTSRRERNEIRFLNRVREKFSDRYDLSKMEYKDCKTPIKIICNIHGEFYKTPESFLDGRGCPLCNPYGGRNRRYAKHEWVMFAGSRTCILYLVKLYDENETFLKIGITAQSSIKKRLKQCKPKYMGDVICFATGNASFIFDKEVELQRLFKEHKYHPLKKFGGYTECYDTSMLNEIRNIFDEINSA